MATDVNIPIWLRLLRDHALFTRNALGPAEEAAVRRAERLGETFELLLAGKPKTVEAIAATQELIEFQCLLLSQAMECRVMVHLPPSGLNQMIDEVQEFLGVLGALPILPPDPFARLLHLHQVWLYDAAAHSGAAVRGLDPSEKPPIAEFHRFGLVFLRLHLLARAQIQIYGKTARLFRAVVGLTRQSQETIEAHLVLVARLEDLRARGETGGTIASLQPNHWLREEGHYLEQVALLLPGLS